MESYAAWGYGMSSVRFICGTLEPHIALEHAMSAFLEMEDTILYSSCFDANGGLFETLFDENDAIISDELNHASIIDGIRLCKAVRYRYRNNDMDDLEAKLKEAQHARFRVIADRRGILYGRDHRESEGHLRSGRALQRDCDGG